MMISITDKSSDFALYNFSTVFYSRYEWRSSCSDIITGRRDWRAASSYKSELLRVYPPLTDFKLRLQKGGLDE